jgi:hypothetical protein
MGHGPRKNLSETRDFFILWAPVGSEPDLLRSEIFRSSVGDGPTLPRAPGSPFGGCQSRRRALALLPIRPLKGAQSVTRFENLCRHHNVGWSSGSPSAFHGSQRDIRRQQSVLQTIGPAASSLSASQAPRGPGVRSICAVCLPKPDKS